MYCEYFIVGDTCPKGDKCDFFHEYDEKRKHFKRKDLKYYNINFNEMVEKDIEQNKSVILKHLTDLFKSKKPMH